jgi:hypothetical protein
MGIFTDHYKPEERGGPNMFLTTDLTDEEKKHIERLMNEITHLHSETISIKVEAVAHLMRSLIDLMCMGGLQPHPGDGTGFGHYIEHLTKEVLDVYAIDSKESTS